jgi:hypothetical protein
MREVRWKRKGKTVTHMKEMSEDEGTFSNEKMADCACRKCKKTNVVVEKKWSSSDGGYEDYKYECQNPECRHVWWIEGPDS